MSEITLLDGSIGQELVKRSGEKPTPLWSTMVMLDDTKLLSEVHDEYFSVGATVATTNTYPVLKDRLERVGLEERLEELWDKAIDTAISSKERNGYPFRITNISYDNPDLVSLYRNKRVDKILMR